MSKLLSLLEKSFLCEKLIDTMILAIAYYTTIRNRVNVYIVINIRNIENLLDNDQNIL